MSVSKQNPDPEPPDFIGLDGHSIPIIFGVKCRPLRVWILLNTSRFMAEASIKSIESAVRGKTVPYIGLDSGSVAALVDSESFDERLYLYRVRPRGTLIRVWRQAGSDRGKRDARYAGRCRSIYASGAKQTVASRRL